VTRASVELMKQSVLFSVEDVKSLPATLPDQGSFGCLIKKYLDPEESRKAEHPSVLHKL
jgi:hypothetical protein